MLKEKVITIKNEDNMQPKHHYKNDNEVRIAILETSVSHIFQALERMEKNIEKGFALVDKKFDAMDEILKTMDERLKTMDNKIETINSRMWTIFLGILVAMGFFPILTKLCMKLIGV